MKSSERYQRHSLIDWFDQQALRRARIVVVGAGAVGNEVLKNLALLGVGRLLIFDPDRIEQPDLTRSVLFHESDVGRFKAEVAAERCRALDPNLEIRPAAADFWDGLTLGEVRAADAVVSCVDNYEARLQLNQLCLLMGADFYNTGIDSRFVTVEIYPFSTGPGCACYECTLPPSVYDAISRRYSCGWLRKAAAQASRIPTTAVTAALAGSLVVSTVLNRISGHPDAPSGAVRCFQDAITLRSTVSKIPRARACIGCGRAGVASIHLRARRTVAPDTVIPLYRAAAGEVELSEAVLMRTSCIACGSQIERCQSARVLTDDVMVCEYCGQTAIQAEFVQALAPGEFIRRFSGKEVPGKYLAYRVSGETILIEMED